MTMTLEAWLSKHSFLEPISHLEAIVANLVQSLPRPAQAETSFESYAPEFEAGIPLLRSSTLGTKLLLSAAGTFEALVSELTKAPITETLASQSSELYKHIAKTENQTGQILASIATESDEASSVPHLGTARYIAWNALAYALSPTIAAFHAWRDKNLWTNGYCPTCGAKPLLSVLTAHEEGRRRNLVCGLCKTQWNVRRLGCPHCGSENEDNLGIFELEYEPNLRIEFCNLCRGYLKTWAGQGEAPRFFSDWATLHLDAIAAERGYLRAGASLYEL
ncbi:MAG: formate dehydrogenase accessory protein FdhE [Syntrophobacteraceae bacterium]